MGESFQKLNLTNAYLFAAAMQDEEICRNVLEIALNKRISRVKAHVEQVLFLDSEFKSVRFDVYASDEEEVSYDVEMQNDDTKNLPKRCRYYQAELDVTSLRPGEDYQQLKQATLFLYVRSIRLEKEDVSMCLKSTARKRTFRLGMRRRRSSLIPMAQIRRM